MPTKTHGFSHRLPEYRAWINMKSRCYNPNSPEFARWGGRGIVVCPRWLASFEDFLEDMGPRPSKGHSLDRWPDADGNYEPGNCRWATKTEQARNFSSFNRLVVVNGQEMPLVEAAEKSALPYNTILYRLRRGWTVDDALNLPQQQGVRPHAS